MESELYFFVDSAANNRVDSSCPQAFTP